MHCIIHRCVLHDWCAKGSGQKTSYHIIFVAMIHIRINLLRKHFFKLKLLVRATTGLISIIVLNLLYHNYFCYRLMFIKFLRYPSSLNYRFQCVFFIFENLCRCGNKYHFENTWPDCLVLQSCTHKWYFCYESVITVGGSSSVLSLLVSFSNMVYVRYVKGK